MVYWLFRSMSFGHVGKRNVKKDQNGILTTESVLTQFLNKPVVLVSHYVCTVNSLNLFSKH